MQSFDTAGCGREPFKGSVSIIFSLGSSVAERQKTGLLGKEVQLLGLLVAQGHIRDVQFFGYGANDRSIKKQINARWVRIVARPGWCFPFAYSLLMPFLQRHFFRQTSVIWTTQAAGAWTALLAAWLYNKPLIVRSSDTLNGIASFMKPLLYRTCEAALVYSDSQKEYIVKNYDISPHKIYVVPNFVDTQIFRPLEGVTYANRMIFAGSIEARDNLESLIKALEGTGWQLDVYGAGSQENDLARLADKTGVALNFLGPIANNELPQILNKYRLAVFPSNAIGVPNVLIEAMGCGLTVLAADTEGINEVVSHGETGWLVKPDATGLRAGINKLTADTDLMTRLGVEAAHRVAQRFSLEKIAHIEGQILDKVQKKIES